jgi:decaheme cytochrome c component MtrC/MtrF-like protein
MKLNHAMTGRQYYGKILVSVAAVLLVVLATSAAQEPSRSMQFPLGTATPSELCGACHKAIYREFATGFGSDLEYKAVVYQSAAGKSLTLPANVSATATLHALAGVDPFPVHARTVEEEGRSCNVCHFPQAFELPDIDKPEMSRPAARPKEQETGGLTCASCHLTPDGKIRGPHEVTAPHQTVADPKIQTSAMCAYCHSMGKRVIGKQTQTFLEWRDDFFKPGLGRQQCQDCHMFRTLRKTADDFDVPVRAVSRHLWTGGHSTQRLQSALNLVIVQTEQGQPKLNFHIINIGAGHSVPTGSNRRGVYLRAEIVRDKRKAVASREWMFAPWYGDRPDDRAFLAEDKKRPDAIAVTQADAQGPHEAPIRAGEERMLSWVPNLTPGDYIVRASLIYDLNRYNDRSFVDDQTEIYRASLSVKIARK